MRIQLSSHLLNANTPGVSTANPKHPLCGIKFNFHNNFRIYSFFPLVISVLVSLVGLVDLIFDTCGLVTRPLVGDSCLLTAILGFLGCLSLLLFVTCTLVAVLVSIRALFVNC